jgi:hypothetical protein
MRLENFNGCGEKSAARRRFVRRGYLNVFFANEWIQMYYSQSNQSSSTIIIHSEVDRRQRKHKHTFLCSGAISERTGWICLTGGIFAVKEQRILESSATALKDCFSNCDLLLREKTRWLFESLHRSHNHKTPHRRCLEQNYIHTLQY